METYLRKHTKAVLFIVATIVALAVSFYFISFKQSPGRSNGSNEVRTERRTNENVDVEYVEEEPRLLTGNRSWEEILKDLEPYMVTLEEAQRHVPVKLALPTYLPEDVTLKGIVIYPAPPGNANFGEISFYYTKGLQIAEYPLNEPFDIEAEYMGDIRSMIDKPRDAGGKTHSQQKITIEGKVGLGRERYDQVYPSGGINRVPSALMFNMEGTGDFEYLGISILADDYSLQEVLKIGQSLEYPE